MSDELNLEQSLAEIANLDVDAFEEQRFEVLPRGAGIFKVEDAGLDIKGNYVVAYFRCRLEEPRGLLGLKAGEEESAYVGKVHTETFFLRNEESLGYLKAFCADIGGQTTGVKVPEMIQSCIGAVFPGRIKHRYDKEDRSRIYANLIPQKPDSSAAA